MARFVFSGRCGCASPGGAIRMPSRPRSSLLRSASTLGFALYFFGFLVIAGEWFQMWQSSQWNAQPSAFRCLASIALVLIVLHLPDANSANSNFPDST
ncbi:MAG TPA: DUF2165 family protein [Methylovirgula sp.]